MAIENEEDRIRAQKAALEEADLALARLGVTDMVVRSELTNRILALAARLAAMSPGQKLAPITPQQAAAMQQAVNTLQAAIASAAAGTQILTAATAIANL